jgi:hypothetical protein
MVQNIGFHHSAKVSTIRDEIGTSKGIYAWYYHPKIRSGDVTKILQQWFDSVENSTEVKANIKQWLTDTYISKYEPFLDRDNWEYKIWEQKNEYHKLIPRKPLSPSIQINQKISWSPLIPTKLIDDLSKNREIAKDFLEELSGLYGFLPPVYIGKAEGKSGIQGRLTTHIKKLEDYNKHSEVTLSKLIDTDAENMTTDSFAVRAAYCGITPDDLWFTFKVIEKPIATKIENFMNRLVNPGLGWQ